MFPYNNRIADVVAAFPAGVYTPADVRNESEPVELTETGTVPAAADFEGRRRLNLNQVPAQQLGMVVEVDGDARALIPYGETPAAGQVAVGMKTGVLEFHSSDAGLAVEVDYHGRGTPLVAMLFNQIGAELAATQTHGLAVASALDDLVEDVEDLDEALGTLSSTVSGLSSALAGKQNADPLLSAIAALTTSADGLIYTTGSDTVATTGLSAFGRDLIDQSSAANARTTLGLGAGDNVSFSSIQSGDGTVSACGLRLGAANRGLYYFGGGTMGFVIGGALQLGLTSGALYPSGTKDLGGDSGARWNKGWFGSGGIDVSGDVVAGRLFRCPSVPPYQVSAFAITLTAASSGGTFVSDGGFDLPDPALVPTNWHARLIFNQMGAYVANGWGGSIVDPEGVFGDSALQSNTSWAMMEIYNDGTNYIVAAYRGGFQSV